MTDSGASWTAGSNGAIVITTGAGQTVTNAITAVTHCSAPPPSPLPSTSSKGHPFLSSPGGIVVIVGVVLIILGLVCAVIVWQKRRMKPTAVPVLDTLGPGNIALSSTGSGEQGV